MNLWISYFTWTPESVYTVGGTRGLSARITLSLETDWTNKEV